MGNTSEWIGIELHPTWFVSFVFTEFLPPEHRNIEVMVKESFEGAQKITQDSKFFQFHYIKNWEPELKATIKVIT